MNRTQGIILYKNVLELMKEAEYIDSDFKEFLEQCLNDYFYNNKKMEHSLESLFRFRKYLVKDSLEIVDTTKE